jgi:hypothetical protein
MKLANNILLKALGILLLTAAILKGWQLLTEPVANNNIWSYRPFLILTIEFELALAIWLLSGLFKKAAWLAAISCFSLFSMITFYKGLTGAESCGCFGSVHVNPWITFFVIDLPSVIALSIFRPKLSLLRSLTSAVTGGRESMKALIVEFLTPLPSLRGFVTAFVIGIVTLCVTTPILAFSKPAMITSSYEVLEPETWVGKELPILEYIDIADTLRKGTWLILLYHYDCPDCARAIQKYEQLANETFSPQVHSGGSMDSQNEPFIKFAFVEVPPYGQGPVSQNSPCTLGRLAGTKEWFVTTPVVALLTDGKVKQAWEEKAPDFETILQNMAQMQKTTEKSRFFSTTNYSTYSPLQGGDAY